LPLEIFIAWRYLKARRSGVFTLLTTLIAVGGITLGVAALIITLSVMSGFHLDIREKILGLQPHLVIINEGMSPIKQYSALENSVKENDNVTATAPFIYGQIMIRNGLINAGAAIKGIDWEAENRLTGLKKLTHGNLSGGLKDNEIIIGRELANALRTFPGEEIILMSPGEAGLIPRMASFKVAGIFHSGMYEYDASLAYVSLGSAQKLFGFHDTVTGVGASVKHWELAAKAEIQLEKSLPPSYLVRSWQQMNHNLFAALKLEKIMMFIILALIIVVAAFNIISNLILLTVEKAREIGILSALGVRRLEIGRIFLFEGLMVGLSGIILGTGSGLGISLALKKYKFIHLPPDVYYLDTLPVRIIAGDVILVIAATLAITLVAALYPAYQATKLDPLEAIRYG